MNRPLRYNTKNKDDILSLVKSFKNDFTAKDVADFLDKNNNHMGLSTIYRVLDNLVNDKIIAQNLSNSKTVYYRYIMPCMSHNHILLKCEVCNEVLHVDCDIVDNLNEHLLDNHKFYLDINQALLPGVCKKCFRKEDKK